VEKRKSREKIKRFTQHNIATPILASLLLPLTYVVARTLLDRRVEGEMIAMLLAFQYLTMVLLIFITVRCLSLKWVWHKRDKEASERLEKLRQRFQQNHEKADEKYREFMAFIMKCNKHDARTKQYAYPAQFIKETNGTFTVYFPDLEGCQTYDDTLEGAAIMAKQALEGYIEVLIEEGGELPLPSKYSDISPKSEYVMMVVADL